MVRRVLVALLCVGACDSTSAEPGELDGGFDGGAITDASDAPATVDAESDAGACPKSLSSFDDGVLVAAAAAFPVVIDGDLDDWSCAKFYRWDKSTAAYIEGKKDAPNAYAVAVSWTKDTLYVAVRAEDPTPNEGNDTTNPYNNDAVEIYLGGQAVYDGAFASVDHQIVVDWKNLAREYQNGPATPPPASFKSAVKKTSTGYTYEMSLGATDLGRTLFAPRTRLGFAATGDDSNGTGQEMWMLWYRPPVTCDRDGGGCCNIFCDTRYFGDLILVQ